MLREAVKVLLLLGELLLELKELLLLALTDGVVLGGLLAALESVTRSQSILANAAQTNGPMRSETNALNVVTHGQCRHLLTLGHRCWGGHQYRQQP